MQQLFAISKTLEGVVDDGKGYKEVFVAVFRLESSRAENLRGIKFLLCKLYFDCFPAKSVECEKGKQ